VARYRIEEYVRWEDIDAAGIINYQAYLRFFGLAEAELLSSAGLYYRFLFEALGIWLAWKLWRERSTASFDVK
jgi:acyl-CoA thioesterase FadM